MHQVDARKIPLSLKPSFVYFGAETFVVVVTMFSVLIIS